MSGASISIEKNQRFSHSILWQLQAEYFEREGINAWNGQVPFFITSNPYIAYQYAQVIVRFVQDCVKHGYDSNQPFYVVELGTGSGQFSYYCLHALKTLQAQLGLTDIKICYVMTDFTEANLSFWESQAILRPFVDDGMLDFALYNLETPETIELRHQVLALTPETLQNPAVLVDNYIFDTVKHDVFRVKNGQLHEALLNATCKPGQLKDGKPVKLENIETHFNNQLCHTEGYYENPALNQVLADYAQTLTEGSFLSPVGAFHCLEHFEAL